MNITLKKTCALQENTKLISYSECMFCSNANKEFRLADFMKKCSLTK